MTRAHAFEPSEPVHARPEPASAEHRGRGGRLPLSRGHTALLLVAGLLLVVDGPAGIAPGAAEARVAAAGRPEAAAMAERPEAAARGVGPEAAATGLDAEDVARRVGRLNPHLTAYERGRIGEAVLRYSAKYGLDPVLVTAVIEVESSARPWALSPKGALGLMQVMPYMIRPMGMAGNASTIETNIEAGCMILAGNIRRLGEEDGISAYFWGSEIRGVSYLNRVRAARDRVRAELRS